MKTKKLLLVLFIFFFSMKSNCLFSQIVKPESFDGTQFLPFGWSSGQINGTDLNNKTERVTAGVFPTCVPHSGAGMVRYRSGFMFNAGEQYFMASPKYDLTNNPGSATITFWMYKDNVNAIKDSVGIYVNDSAVANLSRGSMSYIYGRSRDTVGFNGWKQYTAIIPAGYATSSAYIIFVFTNNEISGSGANIYLDDFSIQTYPKASVLINSQLNYQEIADAGKGLSDLLIIGIKVIVDGAGDGSTNSLRIDSIVTNATGTSSLSDITTSSAKIWYTKGSNSYISNAGNQFGTGITPSFYRDKFTPASTFFLENGDNYFWVTYSTAAGAISENFIDADFNGIYYRQPGYLGADTSRAPLVSSLIGSRQIDVPLCSGIIPTLIQGTGWWASFSNEDYINRVYLRGQNSLIPSYPYLDNNINDIGPYYAPWFGGPAPFTTHPPDYQQFYQTSTVLHPNITAVLVQGAMYPAPILAGGNPAGEGLALQCGTWSNSNYMAAWIDFNKDGDLIDAGELIIPTTVLLANSWVFGTVNVPNTIGTGTYNIVDPSRIVYGNVKMRVREVFATSPILPCQSGYTFGETEDYIISIIPPCPIGTKLWLGYTDDWNTPANWCGGTPTLNDVALIDEVGYLGGTQSGAPFDPVIHSGTNATAKTIRLSGTDTLKIDAPGSSSLQIADSLNISYNTPSGGGGLLKINSSFSDTAQLSNGNIQFIISPFQANKKNSRMQIIYTKDELLAKGMIGGDYIDQLLFHFVKRATVSVASYNNFQVRFATVDSTWAGWPTGTPLSLAPATSAYVSLYGPSTITLPIPMGSAGDYNLNLMSRLYWNGLSNLVIDICFDNTLVSLTGITGPDQLCQTTTTGHIHTMWLSNSSTISGCGLNWPLTGGTIASSSQYRPNITFRFNRPYIKFPINVTGNGATTSGRWNNNGNFIAGKSTVTFNNAAQNQDIGGASVTTFSDLAITKTGGGGSNGVLLGQNINVDSLLILNNGYLDLNAKLLTVKNPLVNSIQQTPPAWIQSENTPIAHGRLSKNIGSTMGSHVFPFGTATGIPIPFTVNLTSGDLGYLTVSTFHTASNNTPYANDGTTAGTVTHMQDLATNLDLSVQNAADRFWQIDKTGPSGMADLSFTINVSERPTLAGATNNTLKPQLWENPNTNGNQGWKIFANAFSHSAITNTVALNGLTQFNGPWVLSNVSQPLSDSLVLCATLPSPPTVTPSSPVSICSGTSLNLNATAAGYSVYWFTVPTGGSGIGTSASDADFPVTPLTTSTYYAEARDSNGCTSISRTATGLITVEPFPGTFISTSGPTTFCSGGSVNLTANGSGTVIWNNGDTNALINVNVSGIYTAVRTNSIGCFDSAQVSVTVNPLPNVAVSASKSSICKNEIITMTASGASTYAWSPATGLSATNGNVVTAQPMVTTTYSITGTSSLGCVKTTTKKITVKTIPNITLTPLNSTICPGSNQLITAGGSATGFSWAPASGLNVTTGPSVTASPPATTIYTVTATNSNGCTGTKTSKITVTCKVSKNLTTTNITGTSADLSWTGQSCATGYRLRYRIVGAALWTTININTNATNYTLTGLLLSTSYEWKVATKCSTNIFAAFSGKLSFTTLSARNNNEPVHAVNDALVVFPNPAKETIHFEFLCEKDGNAQLHVLNNIGQEIYFKNIAVSDGIYADNINISSYASGLYLIKIEKDDEIKTAKFLKE